jgi:hypothetical protein
MVLQWQLKERQFLVMEDLRTLVQLCLVRQERSKLMVFLYVVQATPLLVVMLPAVAEM